MTEDQIKAIAEEYAKIVMNPHRSDPYMTGFEWQAEFDACVEAAEDILGALSTRYCIVEREKVEQEYVYACGRSDQGGYYDGKAEVLEELFGTSMFNQKEE